MSNDMCPICAFVGSGHWYYLKRSQKRPVGGLDFLIFGGTYGVQSEVLVRNVREAPSLGFPCKYLGTVSICNLGCLGGVCVWGRLALWHANFLF